MLPARPTALIAVGFNQCKIYNNASVIVDSDQHKIKGVLQIQEQKKRELTLPLLRGSPLTSKIVRR